LRIKFIGEEYQNQAGDIKEAARIGYPNFAEAIEEGAEYPPVADEDSEFFYNPEKDLTKLKVDSTPVNANTTAPANVDW